MDLSRYLDLFVDESREHIAALSEILSRPQGRADGSAEIQSLFRHLHSLKGMAASMGFVPMRELAHAQHSPRRRATGRRLSLRGQRERGLRLSARRAHFDRAIERTRAGRRIGRHLDRSRAAENQLRSRRQQSRSHAHAAAKLAAADRCGFDLRQAPGRPRRNNAPWPSTRCTWRASARSPTAAS